MSPEDLRHWRADRGLTQADLADMLHTHVSTIKRWEGGSGKTDPPEFLRLALERLDQLLNGTPPR